MKRKSVCLGAFLLVLSLLFTACADLGDFEDEEAYYDSFGSFTLMSLGTGGIGKFERYDVSDLYSKETSDEFKTPVEKGKYQYATLAVEKDMTLDSLALWFHTEVSARITVELYLLANNGYESEFLNDCKVDKTRGEYKLNQVKGVTLPAFLTGKDTLWFDGNGKVSGKDGKSGTYTLAGNSVNFSISTSSGGTATIVEYAGSFSDDMRTLSLTAAEKTGTDSAVSISYSFVEGTDTVSSEVGLTPIARTSFNVPSDKWTSFLIEDFTELGNSVSSVEIEGGQLILMKIVNNTAGAARYGLAPIEFTVTNLMVRAKDVES